MLLKKSICTLLLSSVCFSHTLSWTFCPWIYPVPFSPSWHIISSHSPPSLSACSYLQDQNHRMVRVGRDLCGSSSPIPLPKQGHIQQAAQDLIQVGFEYLRKTRFHNTSGQPVPVLCLPQRKEVFAHVQIELLMLQFVHIVPCPVAGHHWRVWPHPLDTHP